MEGERVCRVGRVQPGEVGSELLLLVDGKADGRDDDDRCPVCEVRAKRCEEANEGLAAAGWEADEDRGVGG